MGIRQAILDELPALRRYARALSGQAGIADDLVQDTVARALEKCRFWQSRRALRPWLFAIMHNLFIDQLRHDRPLQFMPDEAMPEQAETLAPEQLLWRRDLDRALARLPVEQREVLLLVSLEGFSYEEVAQTLRLPLGTVMSRLSRARTRMRLLLSENDIPSGKAIHS